MDNPTRNLIAAARRWRDCRHETDIRKRVESDLLDAIAELDNAAVRTAAPRKRRAA